MTKQNKSDPLDKKIGDKSISEWNDSWKVIPGGFKPKHDELKSHVGLARAILKVETMYILRGIVHPRGGIEKSLQRIRGIDQTGNRGHGAREIRKNIDALELEVLLVGQGHKAAEDTKLLKKALIKYHDPEWNKPASRRMKRIRAGKES